MNRLKLSKLSEFLSSSGSEFQTVGPAKSNARQPYMLSRLRGTVRYLSLLFLSLSSLGPSDLQSLNFGVHVAWRKARDRDVWHQVVSTATLHSEVRQ